MEVTATKGRSRKLASGVALLFAGLFFAALGILTFYFRMAPRFVFALYAIASSITFLMYAVDKTAARKGRWRTPESTLHALSLFGGWPGALIAQQTLRHKCSKATFQIAYKFTVVLNMAATTWLLVPRGQELTLDFLQKLFK